MGRRTEFTVIEEYHPDMDAMVKALRILLESGGEGAAAANDIANGGCAAEGGRTQAAAAAPDTSLQRPAVD